jgi:Flp pilus assembly pilin Flp
MKQVGARFYADENGAALVEATVMLGLFFVLVFGSVDFLMALYQWNAAAKAVAVGARIAAVSSPVSSDIPTLTGLGSGVLPGDPMPSFTRTCNGATSTCDNGGTFDVDALNTIVYGRGSAACGDATSSYTSGMCDIFRAIAPANVVITYSHTDTDGLGYAGRPGGPVLTITVSLQNIPFRFYFLGGLLGFGNITIPAMTTTQTSEDLSSSAP